jgi:hypothetical protein
VEALLVVAFQRPRVYVGLLPIVKVGGEFIGIPLDRIVKVDKEIIIVRDFDTSSAKEVGRRWIEEKSKPVSFKELEKMGL